MLEEAQKVQEWSPVALADMSTGHWRQRFAVIDPYSVAGVGRWRMQDDLAPRRPVRESPTSQLQRAPDLQLDEAPQVLLRRQRPR